jgi:outer membrane protein TolC
MSIRRQPLFGALLGLFLPWSGNALAEEVATLPEPLTLDYALSLIDAQHPGIQAEQAARAKSTAERESAEAQSGLDVSVEGRARWVKPPSIAEDDSVTDDHKLSLFVRKPLYDFGRTSSRVEAAESAAEGVEYRYQAYRSERRVAIMEAFFDVLLADMEYARDNEAMAVSYIALDRLRNRQELGQASDITLLEQEADYQRSRLQLSLSENRQRATRSRLANLLNVPGALPSTVQPPSLDYHRRNLPEFDALLQAALQSNPQILALQADLAASSQRVEAARAERLPRLDGELEASNYTRELGSSDRRRAGVTLQVPLYSGGRTDSAIAIEQAEQYRVQAALDQARYDLREAVLEQWLAIQRLKLERDKAYSEQDYRELYLDRSRANYELEFTADLGDAMVRLSEAQLALAQTDYQMALAWERLDTLVGIDSMSLGGTKGAPAEGENGGDG